MARDGSQDYRDTEAELRKRVEGEVRFDAYSRLLYSTDASIYQADPVGVVVPRHKGDVQAVLEVANRHRTPVLARGGGTSLAGQTVGHAIVMDFSKYMNRVLEVNREELWCRVQPGLVQDALNAHAAPLGMLFGPDTSTSNRATLGGMIGNNSAGAHSVVYGKTLDHVLDLTVLLADGSEAVLTDLSDDALAFKQAGKGLESRIYQQLPRLVESARSLIAERYPKLMRRVSGYNLDEFAKDQPFNLSRLVVGSEGTLACVVEARMRLVPKPPHTALDVLHFHDLQDALAVSESILATKPYAMELTDKPILDLARGNIEQSKRLGFVQGDPDAILMVEYDGETAEEVRDKIDKLEVLRKRENMGYAASLAYEPREVQQIWGVRKAGLGLLLGVKGEKKPIAFVEDTAVDPVKLPEFIKRFREVLAGHGVRAGYYGHCSVGCMHIRPFINLKEAGEVLKMTEISRQISDLVLEFGGAMSGEHGDGLARSHLNEKLFGPDLYQEFRKVKHLFDPQRLLNPGKIVDAPPMTESLRFGASYKTWQPDTVLDFGDQGGFVAAVEMCNGTGACRKTLGGTMCPSYMATLEEEHSTRGRATALRAVLSGKVPRSEFTGERLHRVLDLCLECKGCKAECPSNVDMAKLKYEFLHHYQRVHGVPLRGRLFGRIGALSRWGSRLAPIVNRVNGNFAHRWLLDRFLGIDRRRPLPSFARSNFEGWWKKHEPAGSGARGSVILFHDTFNTYNTPEVAVAATRLLEHLGYRVMTVPRRCCGRPAISKGMLDEARDYAAWNVAKLLPHVEQGVPVVGLEPSCILTLRDEYPDLLRSEPARLLAGRTLLMEELLMQEDVAASLRDGGGPRPPVLLHGHCHQKALVGMAPTVSVLRDAGHEVREVDSGCCGMAGSFGFEKEHYDVSVAIASRRLAPAVEAAAEDVRVVASGISCRQQIEHLTGRRALHPAEVLWEGVREGAG